MYEYLPKFYITTPARVAGFVAQCQHESGDFIWLSENLNYGAKGLRNLFGKYFPNDDLARQYERKPQMIANRIYANRMGNGNEQSNDGWHYRGRGILQITGRSNYTQCSRDLFSDDTLAHNPDLLRTPEYAIISACWFWYKNVLNPICDQGDIVLLSKLINGGTIGLDDRIKHWNHCLDVFETE
jgi:putative chitinase